MSKRIFEIDCSTDLGQRDVRTALKNYTTPHPLPVFLHVEEITDRIPDPQKTQKTKEFEDALASVINQFSRENVSNTPDFILAELLNRLLMDFEIMIAAREQWYNVYLKPAVDAGKRFNEISASEALYGFCSWLSTGPTIKIGSDQPSSDIIRFIEAFIKANSLTFPRENFTEFFNFPEESPYKKNILTGIETPAAALKESIPPEKKEERVRFESSKPDFEISILSVWTEKTKNAVPFVVVDELCARIIWAFIERFQFISDKIEPNVPYQYLTGAQLLDSLTKSMTDKYE